MTREVDRKKEIILGLFNFGFSYTLIAEKVGITRQAVQRRLAKMGLSGGELPKRKPEITLERSIQPKRQCSYPDCSNLHSSRGYCDGHLSQLRRGEKLRPLKRPKKNCDFPGCQKPHSSFGYCVGHANQFKKGQVLKPLKRT